MQEIPIMDDIREWAIKENHLGAFELFEQSYKLSQNLAVLLRGESTFTGALALIYCLSGVIKQDDRLNIDQIYRLLKDLELRPIT